ncbi:MAG: malectin domain-containing carbohydrate-binding protein [Bacteroidales bacterium]
MKTAFRIYLLFMLCVIGFAQIQARTFTIGESTQIIFSSSNFAQTPVGGDTVKILAERKSRLQFRGLTGGDNNPILFVNSGGVVRIKGGTMPAIMFENCKYVKISGRGEAANRYGFLLTGPSFGLSFEQYCSYCEAENLQIDSCSLGVHAKKDFGGHPPVPYPIFTHLAIHGNFINHCSESMYIGETKSPGMEFHHVRIYNNVIVNSGREAFQIANCVDDIEAYNNFCYNSGLENSFGQLNNSQLGGNSIGKFYNNIFIKAPGCGVAIFGMGDMQISNCYFEENQGIFSDDRYTPIVGAPLRIEGNYFYNTNGPSILALKNSYLDLYVNNNKYNTNTDFFTGSLPLVKENNGNKMTGVLPMAFTVENGFFQSDASNPSAYFSMGPKSGLGHVYNETPILNFIPDIIINKGEYSENILTATVADGDDVAISAKNLPTFVSLLQGPNGTAMLKIDTRNQQKGVYYVSVLAVDQSHGAVARQTLKIAIKEVTNHPVTIPDLTDVSLESASKVDVNILGNDPDGDSIRYTIVEKPDFVDFVRSANVAKLEIKPTYLITGHYRVIVKAEDGYSDAVKDTLFIYVELAKLFTNKVIYRVNYGGPELEDTPINWQKDQGNNTSYEANYSAGTGSGTWSGNNNTGAPNNLFGTYRYNGVGMTEMLFEYPCQNGRYQVNLYLAERENEVVNNLVEVFSIYLENTLKQSNLNIYQEVGYTALKKSYLVDVFDSKIDLKLKTSVNNSKLNGIEIRYIQPINMPHQIAKIDTITIFAGKTLHYLLSITDDHFASCGALQVFSDLSTNIGMVQKIDTTFELLFNASINEIGYHPFTLSVSDSCVTVSEQAVAYVIPYHPNAPQLDFVPIQQVMEGDKDTIFVHYTDTDGDAIKLVGSKLPSFSSFVDKGNGTGWLLVNPDYINSGKQSFEVTAIDNYGLKTISEINFEVLDAQPIQRILLNEGMIHDLVQGGSVNPPSLLVDEQSLDPDKKEHPISASWKPYFTNAKAPYYIYFDLGKEYVIRKVKLHDMNNISPLNFSAGSPDNWTDWFVYTTSAYNSWVNFGMNQTTRFIELSQLNATSAEINELAIYGYENNHAPQLIQQILPVFALSTNDTISISYTDFENDLIQISASDLPNFADLHQTGNGQARIYLYGSQKSIGTYSIVLKATDSKNYLSTDILSFEVTKDGLNNIVETKTTSNATILFNKQNRLLTVSSNDRAYYTSIVSLDGRTLLSSNEHQISLALLPKGVCIVVVIDAQTKEILARKLVII